MTTEYSIQKMVSDGTLSTIALGIQYLQRNDIYIRIAGEETPQSGAPSGYTWSFINNTTLKILPVVPNGVEVVVYRRTDVDAMYNIYSQNAQFDEATIDENNQQLLYIAQEYLEQGIPGAGVDTIEFLRNDGYYSYYRIKRTDGSYTDEFIVPSASNSTKVLTRESLRRSYAEAGYNLVDGSFEAGGTVSAASEVLLYESNGVAYSWEGLLLKNVPAGSTPETTGGVNVGAWRPRTDDILRSDLALSDGTALIGLPAGGVLTDIISCVSPEQFGAIGDGVIRQLSEQFGTLTEAQAKYPHVTALTQTIDWAACQAAENYSRGKTKVVPRPFATYRFGQDGLQLAAQSWWDAGDAPMNDKPGVTMIRELPTALPTFGRCYVARVMPTVMGAADVFQRGIIFKGIRLRYPVARRTPVKGTNTICFHGGNAIQSEIDISCWGAEYALYAWSFWGNRGRIRIDTCHKGYFVVPQLTDPERPGSSTTTSNQFDIRSDVTPFPITIGHDAYSQYTGYFEGSVASDGNYDSVNETACGITIIGTITGCRFDLGVEKWEGVFLNRVGNGLADSNFRFGFFPDAHYRMSTGNDGADAAMRVLTGQYASRIQLPPAQRALLNASGGNSSFTFSDTTFYMGNIFTEVGSTRYLCNINSSGGLFTFIGGNVGFTPESGAAPVAFSITEVMKSKVESIGCRSLDLWCAPTTSWRLIGKNKWEQTGETNVLGTLDAGNGYFADFLPPSGYKIRNVKRLSVNLGITGTAIAYRPSLIAYEPVNGPGMPAGAVRAATSYVGGSTPSFNAILEISQ